LDAEVERFHTKDVVITGMNDRVKIYPNPSDHHSIIESPPEPGHAIKIIDLNGRTTKTIADPQAQ
jgi:hypothetical protein